ncbi:dTDP-glucose 4,6-dehydratase [Vibrio owensii]|uniref:NAD-dependent epimerase/dehydratase family protein n=1 Tax=Vibrio owensii TaxID=696485 RepID=UPI002894CFA3|nr:dTDP-glucose 4,6-dehydratase [Vibrio owensii]
MYTVVGGSGFIGKEMVNLLTQQGFDCWVPQKNDESIYTRELGTVIYAAGFGDCKNDPFNVFEANSLLLKNILEKSKFETMIYISSTRVYMNSDDSSVDSNVIIGNEDSRRLFNLTKLVAEELCLLSDRNCIIVRPSNVYGLALNSPLFLPSIIKDAINKGMVNMYVEPSYSKDYISVDDVVRSILNISLLRENNHKVINIASGYNVTAKTISDILVKETSCKVVWHKEKITSENFPITDVSCTKKIIEFNPRSIVEDLVSMINEYKSHSTNKAY